MSSGQHKCNKHVSRKLWTFLLITQTGPLTSLAMRVILLYLIFLSPKTFGGELDLCFDVSKEGTVIYT